MGSKLKLYILVTVDNVCCRSFSMSYNNNSNPTAFLLQNIKKIFIIKERNNVDKIAP